MELLALLLPTTLPISFTFLLRENSPFLNISSGNLNSYFLLLTLRLGLDLVLGLVLVGSFFFPVFKKCRLARLSFFFSSLVTLSDVINSSNATTTFSTFLADSRADVKSAL